MYIIESPEACKTTETEKTRKNADNTEINIELRNESDRKTEWAIWHGTLKGNHWVGTNNNRGVRVYP